ncbi:hypothetical protein BKI52_23940 [marine bacterium AO1-C]|nr:hypothetical protein BKI52_23940 [marine bacterium AO1-C]
MLTLIQTPVILAAIVIFYESLFYLFKQNDKEGYQALIPIMNHLVLLKLSNRPLWWIVPVYIPFIRLIPKYFINLSIAKSYGKSNGFAIGMTILPWYFYGVISLNTQDNEQEEITL